MRFWLCAAESKIIKDVAENQDERRKESKMEAAVILAKCSKRKQMYGIRTQKMQDGDWWRTWTFPIDKQRAHKEGYDLMRVQGTLKYTTEYPGCPYCRTKSFVQCNRCKKITCLNNETQLDCEWCGNNMNNIVTADSFEMFGGDI